MRRIIYFFYYLLGLDWKKFKLFSGYVTLIGKKKTLSSLLIDILYSVFRYNISILDYFYFRFFELTNKERSSYAGTGFMYEYQLQQNPKNSRSILENKIEFLKTYRDFIDRQFFELKDLNSFSHGDLLKISQKWVAKSIDGQVGREVEVFDLSEVGLDKIRSEMTTKSYTLLEEYVYQHHALMELSPSGLNTVRIFTQLDHNENIVLLGARLRISVNSPIDNLGAGNLAAPISFDSGVVTGPAVYSDITKREVEIHPVTGAVIRGFVVPYWKETLEMIEKATLFRPENRSIGWDVAISENGPQLIEGNHNWCKLLWQLPVKKGLKKDLLKFK